MRVELYTMLTTITSPVMNNAESASFNNMAAPRPSSSILLTSSAPVRFKSSAALICLIQSLFVFSVSRTAGVTHWKLQDNAITPAATDLSASGQARHEDLFAMSLPTTDPEFAVLLRHATKGPATGVGAGNRGTGRTPRACPVVSITMEGEEMEGSRQRCTTGGAKKATDISSSDVTMASRSCEGKCGGCQGNDNSGSCDGHGRSRSGSGHVARETNGKEETGGTVITKQPRNPDGSGPM